MAGRSLTVLHYVQSWLPISEQFVAGVVQGSRHRSVVVSRLSFEHLDAFPCRPRHTLSLIPAAWPHSSWQRRLISGRLLWIAGEHRVGTVHVHHGYRLRDVEGLARHGRPTVAAFHGDDLTAFAGRWPGTFDGVWDWLAAVVVPSAYLADIAVAMGAKPDTVQVIPAGVDTAFFTPAPLPAEPEVVFVGRFVEKKGLDVLLAAWPLVAAQVPEARLRLLGYGPLEALARSGGPTVTVELADPTQRAEQVRTALRRARVVVTPSRTAADGDVETLLLVNLEAQATGRPVVTTRHGGIPEYVDEGRTALVVPEADPAALAEALIAVLQDGALAERLGRAGPAWAARLDQAACTGRIDDLHTGLA